MILRDCEQQFLSEGETRRHILVACGRAQVRGIAEVTCDVGDGDGYYTIKPSADREDTEG